MNLSWEQMGDSVIDFRVYRFAYELRWYRDINRPYYGTFFLVKEGNMNEFVLFLMSFVFVFIIYQIFIIGPAKKRKSGKSKNKNDESKEVTEIKYLVKRYRLDMKKVSYNQLLQIVALVSSFDISLVVSIILSFDNFILEILIGFVSTLLIILISYHFVYLFYKKKGMISND